MEGLTGWCLGACLPLRFPAHSSKISRSSSRRPGPFLVLAARDDRHLDKWDQMELKFGKLLGEDPKLTLAKIIARKENPDVSYLDVEKSFQKDKGKMNDVMSNMPAHVLEGKEMLSPVSHGAHNSHGQNKLNLSRPIMNKVDKSTAIDEEIAFVDGHEKQLPQNVIEKASTSNITLRKPHVLHDDEGDEAYSSKFRIKPNLVFQKKTSSNPFSREASLLKKPEMVQLPLKPLEERINSDNLVDTNSTNNDVVMGENNKEWTLDTNGFLIGLQRPMRQGALENDGQSSGIPLYANLISHKNDLSVDADLIEKPNGQDYSDREGLHASAMEAAISNDKASIHSTDATKFQSVDEKGSQDHDWKRAEKLLSLGGRGEVELISSSSRGFVVSFGSLIGFLPYRNLGTKWKFLAFESWLRKQGLDPSIYRQNLGIVGNYDNQRKNPALNSNEIIEKVEVSLSDMKFKELLEVYEEEKIKYLSSFVGQRLRVSVIHADRHLRRLIFSGRPKENEELAEKKRSLMAKLNVGDIVKCCIKKITYFGIFVEVEGVSALIHQSEISWDMTLDPTAFYKIGQVVEAKVHQLDFAFERITLSLKEVTPDPLNERLESVVSGRTCLGENLQSSQADVEWADVESLIKELQRVDGIINVSKGRFFLSPSLAPTFQVYMSSMFDNQYKLLARFENKVQEIMVQTSLHKEQLKHAIMTCTNAVQ